MPQFAKRLGAFLLLAAGPTWPASTVCAASAAPAASKAVQIRFVGRINGVPFDCTKKYAQVGRTKAVYEPQDFRMYISGIALIRAHGESVPVALTDDGVWQAHNVALLDFEDAKGTCQNGTPQLHTTLTGTVAAHDDYTGLAFVMAVPFAYDHQDASAASPPFDQAGLFWGWQAGYKFLTLDARIDGQHGHAVHVASTGCQMDVPGRVTRCRAPNEVVVQLAGFDAERNVVVADVGHLLAGSTLQPTPKPRGPKGKPSSHVALANGCMSEPYNSNCAPIFANLGLPFDGRAAQPSEQRFFSVE